MPPRFAHHDVLIITANPASRRAAINAALAADPEFGPNMFSVPLAAPGNPDVVTHYSTGQINIRVKQLTKMQALLGTNWQFVKRHKEKTFQQALIDDNLKHDRNRPITP
jgi:hypothetical protein